MKKLHGLDKYVIFSISVLLIYTVAEFIVSTITGVEHATLSTVLFGCLGAPELLGCCLIKIFKLRHEGEDECVYPADDSADSADL